MGINVLYLGHLSSALEIGHHFRRREKVSDTLLDCMETKQLRYQVLQIKYSMEVKQPWVQVKNIGVSKCRHSSLNTLKIHSSVYFRRNGKLSVLISD